AGLCQSLAGADLSVIRLGREHQATAGQRAVEPDGAGTALTLLAGVLRAEQAELLPKKREKTCPGPDRRFAPFAVDAGPHNHVGNLRSLSAHASERRASTRQPCRR